MRKFYTLLLLLLFPLSTLFADVISPEKALKIAETFWNSKVPQKAASFRLYSDVRKGRAADRLSAQDKDAQYYIFAADNNEGFVIVSGDDRLAPIAAYSAGSMQGDMPDAMVAWLEEYSCYVDAVRAGTIEPYISKASANKPIGQLMKTTWDQGAPYNALCPRINGSLAPTGCTATAMAQIMKYHNWPVSPKKAITWDNNITGTSETIDITKNTYEWSKMLNSYSGSYSQQNADAVARLMVDVGKAINSSYALAGTGSNNVYASGALVKVFDYSSDLKIAYRSEYTDDEWFAMVRENLEAKRPLLYTGNSPKLDSGHAFVCDGIDENNMLHINWGWGGAYDGYFDMAYMAPDDVGTGGGAGQYNVGQAVVANIYPRPTDEKSKGGDPSMYYMKPYHPTEQREVEICEARIANGAATVKFVSYFLNWSHSSTTFDIAIKIVKNDGTEFISELQGANTTIDVNGANGYVISSGINTSNKNAADYLSAGKHKLCVVYKKKGSSVYEKMRGVANNMIVEVGSTSVKLYNEVPAPKLSEMTFSPTPVYVGDKIGFEAKFVNTSEVNGFILVFPILNKLQDDGTWTATSLLSSYASLVEVFDKQESALMFDLNVKLAESGKYFISFGYNLKNYYTDHGLVPDTKNMSIIEGTSDTLDIRALPEGALPSVSKMEVANVYMGNNIRGRVSIANTAKNGEAYTGTVGVYVQETGGSEYLLHTAEISNLRSGGSRTISFESSDYYPGLSEGKYKLSVREYKDGEWLAVRQTIDNCYFVIMASSEQMLYASDMIDINGGRDVVAGEKFDTKIQLTCMNGDFEGYIKVNTLDGLTEIATSDYVAVSLKEGVPQTITIPCMCGSNAEIGKWNMKISYYSSSKFLKGDVSNNNVVYPGNGSFMVGDGTDVVTLLGEDVVVTAANGLIVVDAKDCDVTVHSVSGKIVYAGDDATIPVGKGVYIVTVNKGANRVKTQKVIVR